MKAIMKKVNKEKTLQKIMDKANGSIGISIDTAKLNEELKKPTAESFLVKACKFLSLQPVYEPEPC
jgi:hypothetical protein